MAAIDHILDRKIKKEFLLDAKWRGLRCSGSEAQAVEVDGTVLTGSIDWDYSRYLGDRFYVYVEGRYVVLAVDNDIHHPPKPRLRWGPEPTSGSSDD